MSPAAMLAESLVDGLGLL